MAARREKERQQYIKEREELKAKHGQKSVTNIQTKFSSTSNENERKFKAATVGMVTLEEFRKVSFYMMQAKVVIRSITVLRRP